MEKVRENAGARSKLFRAHSIIHNESLCCKSMEMQNVTAIDGKTVDYGRASAPNHRQFHRDMRLGWVAMLCHVYEPRHETRLGCHAVSRVRAET